ncbi:hypothetical protein BLOT_010942 [Blomia tropicalis]|nr:hypothetical protein BLOT_010942 [Blomia tropicalis]
MLENWELKSNMIERIDEWLCIKMKNPNYCVNLKQRRTREKKSSYGDCSTSPSKAIAKITSSKIMSSSNMTSGVAAIHPECNSVPNKSATTTATADYQRYNYCFGAIGSERRVISRHESNLVYYEQEKFYIKQECNTNCIIYDRESTMTNHQDIELPSSYSNRSHYGNIVESIQSNGNHFAPATPIPPPPSSYLSIENDQLKPIPFHSTNYFEQPAVVKMEQNPCDSGIYPQSSIIYPMNEYHETTMTDQHHQTDAYRQTYEHNCNNVNQYGFVGYGESVPNVQSSTNYYPEYYSNNEHLETTQPEMEHTGQEQHQQQQLISNYDNVYNNSTAYHQQDFYPDYSQSNPDYYSNNPISSTPVESEIEHQLTYHHHHCNQFNDVYSQSFLLTNK